MEAGALKVQRHAALALALLSRAQRPKVGRRLGHHVVEQLELDAPRRLAADRHVEKHLAARGLAGARASKRKEKKGKARKLRQAPHQRPPLPLPRRHAAPPRLKGKERRSKSALRERPLCRSVRVTQRAAPRVTAHAGEGMFRLLRKKAKSRAGAAHRETSTNKVRRTILLNSCL
jgi:hypothetical protein